VLALAVLLAAALAGCGGSGGAKKKSPTPTGARSHVVVVVMENLAYSDVIGSLKFAYLNTLVPKAAVPVQMFGVAHPSLTNYLALIAGDTFGVTVDCTTCRFRGPTLADQLTGAGLSWKGYMQSMPRPCFTGPFFGRYPPSYPLLDRRYRLLPGWGQRYAKKHDPFVYFDTITSNPRKCGNVVPLSQLDADLRNGGLPDYSMIAPDRCFDTHDCILPAGDGFLQTWVPRILPHLGPHGFLMITWDEGRTNRSCCGGLARGGRIATFLLGPDVIPGATGTADYSHYSTLRTIEDAFRLPHMRRAGNAAVVPFDALFSRPPRLRG
jgi:hypothetical protein